jgi:hypothetical protein
MNNPGRDEGEGAGRADPFVVADEDPVLALEY